jgi:hypothetical protein
LYRHWLGRQRRGLAPFIVLNPSPLHGPIVKKSDKGKGKKPQRYEDVSDDPVDDDGEEEDGEDGNDDDVEDDDGDDDDGVGHVEKADELNAPKIGPPTRKEKTKHAIQAAAGPSSLSQPKPAPKGRKPKNSKGGKQSVKATKETVNGDDRKLPENTKRKREVEVGLVGEPPLKTQKTDTLRKSGRVAANAEVDETKKASHLIYDLNIIQLIFFRRDEEKRGPLWTKKAQIERDLASKRKIRVRKGQEMPQCMFLTLRRYIAHIFVPQCLPGGISATWSQN